MARELSRVFRIFVPESFFSISTFGRPVVKHGGFLLSLLLNLHSFFIVITICTVALGNAAVFPFCPEWPFLSRFPGLSVLGGISYRF